MNDVKIAREVLNLFTFGSGSNSLSIEAITAKRIYDKHNGRAMTACREALDILGKPKTKSQLELALGLLVYTGVGGYEMKIEYTNRLHNGDYIDDSPKQAKPVHYDVKEHERQVKAFQLSDLGQAYERTDLVKALSAYIKALKLSPDSAANVRSIARVLNRLGRMDESIEFLQSLKTTKYYKSEFDLRFDFNQENVFKKIVDECLADSLKKKEKGYIYRPRKK